MSVFEGILGALLLVLPWREGGAAPDALALVHTLVFAAGAASLLGSLGEGRIELRLPWALVAFVPLLLVGAAGTIRAEYLYGAFDTYWDQVVALILALALATRAPSSVFSRRAAAGVVLLGAAQAVPSVITRFTEGAVLSPSFVNANHLAAYLNVAALAALERGGWLPWPRRPGSPEPAAAGAARGLLLWPWRAGAVVCLAGTVAIASRGALLALTLTLAGLLAFSASGRTRRRLLALVGVAVLGAAALLSVRMRFAATDDPYRYDRPRLWAAALAAFREAPLLGLGPGMYEHRSVRHNFPQERALFRYSKEPHSAHSQPIQTLAEEGAAGLAALGLLAAAGWTGLARAARSGGEAGSSGRAGLAALAVVGVHSLFETPFEAPAIPMTLILLAWPALHPRDPVEAAAAFDLRWPAGPGAASRRAAVLVSAASVAAVLYGLGAAGPFLAHAAARYAEGAAPSGERKDLALRLAAALNPLQPFPAYRRAREAMAGGGAIPPSVFASALDALERTARLEPGDPSAHALMGRLYARAAAELPGAGPPALRAAERRYGEAILRAPRDARLLVERGALRLAAGRPEEALADARAALGLEPLALAARQLEIEAHLAAGEEAGAARAVRDLDAASRRLGAHAPLNGYEAYLMQVDGRSLAEARRRLASLLLLVPPGDLLGGGD